MKAWVICLMVISIFMMIEPTLAAGGGKFLNPGVLDPCLRPNPPPGCQAPGSAGKPRERVNEYKAGCSKLTRCNRVG
ncbi:Protein RALF-like 30 [Arabidopsis thaliana]|uniref:RALFL30 n=4 Tax=Arabidopsis TaxID=3701 RepID=A0A178UVT0_ARATH|nr:Rapid ALkalinization Factor [Arabidopsis thaliana x Arabidopsis arenosa]KAG7620268.1 Rapid ALkalinization Factor [Arabidopsis suecica]OAO97620.1 RALFL30 [Arabidopsis thaliana]